MIKDTQKYNQDHNLEIKNRCRQYILTQQWVQFLPSPTHEMCLGCFAMSSLMKLVSSCLNRKVLNKLSL